MGKAHGKLVISPNEEGRPKSNRQPTGATNGGPTKTATEVVKGNADLDVPLIDDVTEAVDANQGEIVSNHQLGDGDNQATTEDCNGSTGNAKPDDRAGAGDVKRTQSGKKGKNPLKWINRRLSRKSEASKHHKPEAEQTDAKDGADSAEGSKGEVASAGDKSASSLVEEVMTSPTVTQAEEAVADISEGMATVSQSPMETAVVEDIHQDSNGVEHEQPVVEPTAEPTEQHDSPKRKRRVEIIHVMSSSTEVQGSDEEAEEHTADEPKMDAPNEGGEEEKPVATDLPSNDDDQCENYVPVDTNNTNVNSEDVVEEKHEETVNGVHDEEVNGLHQDTVDEVPEDMMNASPKGGLPANLTGEDLTNGSAHEAAAPLLDHNQELSCEPVI